MDFIVVRFALISIDILLERIAKTQEALGQVSPTIQPITFTEDPDENDRLWSVRRGLIPMVSICF